MMAPTVPLSVVDLSSIVEGSSIAEALRRTLDLAPRAESWGCRRYWIAEHDNLEGVASSATAVLIGQVVARTSTMRVGSGESCCPVTLRW